jgi:lipopolysaccharide transport system permease protein
MGAAARPAERELVIEPTRGWRSLRLAEAWEYRELLFFLVWRDIKVRYKQTALGAAWAALQPFLLMLIFTLVIGRFAGLSDETPGGVPYPLLVFAGLVPWTLFSQALSASADSLVGNAHLVSKVYFPRLLLPVAAASSYLVDFFVAVVVLAALMAYYGEAPTWGIVLAPVLALYALLAAVACGTWLTALNVRYRDVRYAIPFLVQLWLFVSPVAYWSGKVPESLRLVYALNPMTGVIEGFRWALFGLDWRLTGVVAVSVAATAVLLGSGLYYFRRVERTFADVV